MHQLSIFEAKALVPEIDRKFLDFHRQNPHVYAGLVKLAREIKFIGKKKKYGIKAAYENLRWDIIKETRGEDDLKLNNNYTALYSRLIMAMEPDLDGFFETRARKAG